MLCVRRIGVGEMTVKIISSIGPASGDIEILRKMVQAGVNGFRINFVHGSPDEWSKYVSYVRKIENECGKPIALIGDLQGPSLRIGILDKPIELKRGETVKIVLADKAEGGDKRIIPVPQPKFFEAVDVGDTLVLDDGRVRLNVVDIHGSNELEAVALTRAIVKSRKAIVIAGKDLDVPALSEKDIKDVKFAIEQDFDYISLSYVRHVEDIEILRSLLKRYGAEDIGIIAKIETRSAIANLRDIVAASDAVLIARGDLGMNFSLEEVHYYQKIIIDTCIELGKPVIVATQLLESMIENPVPTRAEVVDISNAVEHGVDALMLTGETSIGKYPLEAVKWLRRIVSYAERRLLVKQYDYIAKRARRALNDIQTAFAKGVLELAEDIGAKLIVFSMRGVTALRLARLRPRIPVYVATPNRKVMRKLSIVWGLETFYVDATSYDEGLSKALEKAKELGVVSYGDVTVLTYGLREPRQYIEVLKLEPQ